MSTVVVTNMPFWAEKIGVPRTLGVESPFGHILGQPHNRQMQMQVVRQALAVLEEASMPGTVVHSDEPWPTSFEEACRISRPDAAPPIAAEMGRYIGSFLRGMRRGKR
jgi:hypothetical protein